jgi:WS/DGAT/MGAT family acyltransferase
MPSLSVIDLAMFSLETAERPFNIGPLVVLAPPANHRGNFADKLVQKMLHRPLGEPFNYRLVTPTVGVPYLAVDKKADASQHVHRLTLPAPGSMEQLCAAVCELHETRIDRSRPLWDLYVIDGLEGRKVAVYAKVHHGIIDGRAFVNVVDTWLAKSPRAKAVRALWEGVAHAPRANRTRPAATRVMRGAAGSTAAAVGLCRMLAKQVLPSLGMKDGMGLPMLNVSGAYHATPTEERSFAFCTLPLAEVKAVAKARSATVNDVLLAVTDIAMTRHLRKRDRPPRTPLVADMPLALKDARGGNQIAVLQFPLGAPHMAPIARLAAIREHAAEVKHVVLKETPDTVMLYTTVVHGLPALLERLGAKNAPRVSNVLVSNPFGLEGERYLMGAHAELVLPVSVVAAGQMLNITAVTLAEKLQIGFLAMPKAVPRVDKLAMYTVEAFDELRRDSKALHKSVRSSNTIREPQA